MAGCAVVICEMTFQYRKLSPFRVGRRREKLLSNAEISKDAI